MSLACLSNYVNSQNCFENLYKNLHILFSAWVLDLVFGLKIEFWQKRSFDRQVRKGRVESNLMVLANSKSQSNKLNFFQRTKKISISTFGNFKTLNYSVH